MTTYYLALPTGQRIQLSADVLRIGRLPFDPSRHTSIGDLINEDARVEQDCLYLPDPCVSRQHAVMSRMNDGNYAIADAESRSGTFVNDDQIKDSLPLKTGDRIKIGQSCIEYCEWNDQGAESRWINLGSD
jgi:pSer/pThr/pTyr-binding forkhead associated (FHA) protein